MMTTHQNERNMTSSTPNSARYGKSAADISANYDLVSLTKSHQEVQQENVNENIYSRPVDLSQSNSKHINSKYSYKDVMTSSCPSVSIFKNYELSQNGSSINGGSNVLEKLSAQHGIQNHHLIKGEEIYSNGNNSGISSGLITSVSKTSVDRPYSTLINQSPPPRPPSLLRRNKPMNTSPHHHHYYHHQRDSGHASIGSSEDLSLAPPLPPRYSCKYQVYICPSMCIVYSFKSTFRLLNYFFPFQ